MSKFLLPAGFRRFFFNWYMRNHESKDHNSIGFERANSFGILVNMDQDQSLELARKYCKDLESLDKKAEILAYKKKMQDDEAPSDSGADTAVALFTSKDLNWYDRPDHPGVKHFIKKEFDVLINTDLSHNVALEYVAATSHAQFRIGKYDDDRANNYELMIEMQESNDHQYFYKQVDHYLKMIKE